MGTQLAVLINSLIKMTGKKNEAMVMKFLIPTALAFTLLALTVPSEGHHAFTSFWRMDETVQITGVVKSLKLINPHSEFVLAVTDESGVETDWLVVSLGTGTAILRAGWTQETLPVGMAVTVEGSPPRRAGTPAIVAGKITRPDGSEVWFGGGGGIPSG